MALAEAMTGKGSIMRIPQISREGATGILDKVVGLTKEIVGEVVDSTDLVKSGETQQTKGSETLKATRERAKASAHSAKAKAHETKQRVSAAQKDSS
jgi:uncharacterized protein YjbJ (UPF0337 family)